MAVLKKFDWVNEFKTYDWDLPLIADLGLRPFRGKTWQEIYIGHVDLKTP